MKIKLALILFLMFGRTLVRGQDTVIVSDSTNNFLIGKSLWILEDKNDEYKFNDIIKSNEFIKSTYEVPNLSVSNSSFWIKFKVKNNTNSEILLLELDYPLMDEFY